jgi:hypothetical protein
MNLYDMQDHIQNLTGLVGSKQASLQTLYKSLGLNYEEERVKKAINKAKREKLNNELFWAKEKAEEAKKRVQELSDKKALLEAEEQVKKLESQLKDLV